MARKKGQLNLDKNLNNQLYNSKLVKSKSETIALSKAKSRERKDGKIPLRLGDTNNTVVLYSPVKWSKKRPKWGEEEIREYYINMFKLKN